MSTDKTILITGAAGYIGQLLGHRFHDNGLNVIGIDIRDTEQTRFLFEIMDICDTGLTDFMREHKVTHVVHLASIVEPSKDRERDFQIDVIGTKNVLRACQDSGVQHLTVTSSGAAYGYHADNPEWLLEQHPLRGNQEFSYSDHKRQVEEILAQYRSELPQLKQLIFRPGTVLGANTNNLITRLFTGRFLLAIQGSPSPFVFIWDQDVIAAIEQGVIEDKTGIFNMAGDGALNVHQLAELLKKPVLTLPAKLVSGLLWLARKLGLTRYGPEQVNFLRYRPVLSNTALKQAFGYIPAKTSKEVFEFYLSQKK